jgi:RNA polymerase sigma-70 factor (ECF subfamily)
MVFSAGIVLFFLAILSPFVSEEHQHLDDQELVACALRDKQKFALIVKRYEEALQRYIYRLGCRDRSAAQDILQEVFIKAYIYLNDYDASLSFSSWIYRIVHNETMSFFRKERIRPQLLETDENLLLLEKMTDEGSLTLQQDKDIAAKALREAVGTLDAKFRDVIVLKFFEEKNYEEISDILQIPVGTVGTLINRAKGKLKIALSGLYR